MRNLFILLKALALCSLAANIHATTTSSLRRTNDNDASKVKTSAVQRTLQDGLVCLIQVLDGQLDDGTGKEFYQCFLDKDNDGFYEYAYMIDLPADFVEANDECIRSSADCYLTIPGAEVIDDENMISHPMISVPASAQISAFQSDNNDGGERRQLAITGDNPTLVVRVSTSDSISSSPSPSAADLAGSVFGLGPKRLANNMADQYYLCSNKQLSFSPFNVGNNIVNGVVEVTLSTATFGEDMFSLTNKMYQAAVDKVGNNLSLARHIMYVVPFGIQFDGSVDWVAYANVNGKSSYYNNRWGNRLSAQMHEVGHNLGMEHSNEDGEEYGNTSGMMGLSHQETNGPKMCFDPFHHYKFGWFSSQTVFVNPASNGPWTGEIASFLDAESTILDVIIRLGNTYMQLNSAKSYNSGTKEKKNEVVLVQGRYRASNLLAGLGSGESFSVGDNTVHVCSISFGSIDTAQISIYASNQSSGCPGGGPTNGPSDPWYCIIPFLC